MLSKNWGISTKNLENLFNAQNSDHMATQALAGMGSGNGLLSDGTKPLPESVLTHQQRC